jgi:ABC-type cobalt transport system substrate-binding protein
MYGGETMLNKKTLKTLVKVVVVLLVVMLLIPNVVFADTGGGGGGDTDAAKQVIEIVTKVFAALFAFTGAALLIEGLYTWIQAHANEDSHGMNIGRRSITIGIILLLLAGASTIGDLAGLAQKFLDLSKTNPTKP